MDKQTATDHLRDTGRLDVGASSVDTLAGDIGIDNADSGVQVGPGCLVLELNRKGIITSVIEGDSSAVELPSADPTGSTLDAIWSPVIAERLRNHVKRTLRGRQVRCEEIDDAEAGKHYEFIFVTRGRDRVLMVVRDVSANRSEMDRMHTLAYTDGTTGLPNREHLLEELAKVTDLSRLKEHRAAVLCLEFDRVDLQNAAPGKMMQDALLNELANRMANNLRGANDPSPIDHERYSIAARTDFRQFVIVLPKIEGGNDAVAVAKRITSALQEPVQMGDKECRVAVHAGIALFPQDGTEAPMLLENAHSAMQDAKSDHSTQYKFHSGTVRLRALQRQDLELELRAALDAEELDLNYLPIVDAQTGRCVAAEALLRWPAAVFGAQPIDNVVALAEKTGMIVPIGEWVMRRACEQLARWHQAGHTDLRLAVNLSGQEFSRENLPGTTAAIIDNCGLDPASIDIEITEHVLFRDALKEFQACEAMKRIGVKLTVDDYGTGVCSLSHLAESPVDAVKIDVSMVAQLEASAANRAACAAAAAMARELGYRIIAEGVENETQADILRGQGCDFLQGYSISQPLYADDLGEFLLQQPEELELQD